MHYEDLGSVDYLAAWELQREVHAAVADGGPDTVLLLEHPPVFTAGKRTEPHERPLDPAAPTVIDVDRGGKITFHGPGQLVGYPIVAAARPRQGRRLRTPRRGGADRASAPTSASPPPACPGRSGVWLAGRRPRARSARSPRSASGSAAA